jgi:lysyl-tRNA synthetase class 2
MPAVESSAIVQAQYAQATAELTITFTSGRTYRYDAVPESVYRALLAAPSKGRFLNARIKDVYPFIEVKP